MVSKDSYVGELVNYIKKNLKKGYTAESLKWALISQDHSKLEIEKAIRIANEELAAEAPKLETKPEIKYEVVDYVQEKKPFWKRLFGI